MRVHSVLGASWAPQDAITTTESSYEAGAAASGPVGTPSAVEVILPAQSVTSLVLASP